MSIHIRNLNSDHIGQWNETGLLGEKQEAMIKV